MQLALLVIAGCTPPQPMPPLTGFAPLAGNRGAAASHAGAEICGNHAILTGPSKPPKGAVIVPSGDNSSLAPAAHTTYWFASGIHTFGPNPYGQIIAADGDVFIGGPNAVLDGRLKNQYAFTAAASNVTVEYLTIRRFGAVGSNNGQAVVNHNSGRNWSIQNNTVIDDAGAGVFLGPHSVTRYNCLSHNGEYGFASYKSHGDNDVVLDHNEIVANNTYNWEKHVYGCGCSGGGKFWDTNGGTVTNNWVHDNRGPALWADTDNNDFDFARNDIEENTGEGIIVEISYNARIENNTFVRNALVDGPKNPGFPTGAIYLSESGGDSRVPARYSTITVANNKFVDNWSGVVLFENADRFCGSPGNSSGHFCTLVDPGVVNLKPASVEKFVWSRTIRTAAGKRRALSSATISFRSIRRTFAVAARRFRAACKDCSQTGGRIHGGRPTGGRSSRRRLHSARTTCSQKTRTPGRGSTWRTIKAEC